SFIESGPSPQRTAAPPSVAPAQPKGATPAGASEPQTLPPTKPAAGDRVEQMSVMRKKIAEHMVLSRRTSAHVTTVYEIDMSKISKLREENRAAFEDRTGTKLTYMPFIFKAVTDAIRKLPVFKS